jgi:hypothetical protein
MTALKPTAGGESRRCTRPALRRAGSPAEADFVRFPFLVSRDMLSLDNLSEVVLIRGFMGKYP